MVGKSGDYMFMGEYHYSIDDKGRITIPSKLRGYLGETFIITRGLDNCLFVYPKNEWDIIINKYKSLPNTKNARDFMRFFLSGATESEIDKHGRVNVSTPLVKYAGLSKECVIIGVNERIEIWSKDRWENFIETNEDNLSLIADELFASNFQV